MAGRQDDEFEDERTAKTRGQLRNSHRQYTRLCRYHCVNYLRTQSTLVLEYQLNTTELAHKQKAMRRKLQKLTLRKSDIQRQRLRDDSLQLPAIGADTEEKPESKSPRSSDVDLQPFIAKWKAYKKKTEEPMTSEEKSSTLRDYADIAKIAPKPKYVRENSLSSVGQGGINQWLGIGEKKGKRVLRGKSLTRVATPPVGNTMPVPTVQAEKKMSFAALVQAVMSMRTAGNVLINKG